MKDKEIFDGFCVTLVKKAKAGESYFAAEEIIGKSVKNSTKNIEDVKKKGKVFYDDLNKKACEIFKELATCIEKGLTPDSGEVQRVIQKHHALMELFHDATQKVYIAMAQLYEEHPEMRKQLDPFHSNLATFMAEAMRVFADRKLS